MCALVAAAVLLIVACPRCSQRCIRFRRLQDHCLFSRRHHQYRFRHRRLSFAAVAAIVSTVAATDSVSTCLYTAIVSADAAISVATAAACCPRLRERRTVAVDAIVKSV